ncbi:putative MFS monosaccharide transporter [Hypoxylon sp. FL1284]|nr:putative MFS monosaccharide transporter [Hypoxylon sp. FL1284]
MAGWYSLGIALFAAIGTLLFGFDTGIATTTIAHESWIDYMNHPSNGLTGAVVAVYIAGEAVGALSQTFIGDKLGRIRFMQLLCAVVTVGTAIQTASVNIGMFLAGRAIAGVAVGGMVATVPIYLTEISAPDRRGLIGGISGCGIAFGTMLSNWVGFACSYAPYGQTQWRLPLAIQIPWGLVMFAGLATFMPDSPRQLLRNGKADAARREFARVRRDLTSRDEVAAEFALMRAQIEFELAREVRSYREVFTLFGRRAFVSIVVQTMTSLTGINVIQYYQTTLYKSLGIGPETILALAGVYGTVAFVANVVTTRFLTDQWGRRNMILAGCVGLVLIMIYSAVMQREFQYSDNRVGKGFAVLGIYLYVAWYYAMINSTTWLYGAEVLPIALRSKVMGLAAAGHFIVNVAVTEAGPSAFANIGENYYYVFVGCTVVFFLLAYFFFPETRRKTLEEVARAFGDKVVLVDEREGGVGTDQAALDIRDDEESASVAKDENKNQATASTTSTVPPSHVSAT